MADLGWEDDDVTWGGALLSSKNFAPVFPVANNFFILGYDGAVPLNMFVERKAILMVPGRTLLGTRVWPQIIGPAGATIQISLGAHDKPDGAITWEGPYDFMIDMDEEQDFAISGRYLAIRFESSGVPVWTLQSYLLEYAILGQH